MDGEIVSEKLLEALSIVGRCLQRMMPRPGRDNGTDCPDCSRQTKSAAAPIAQKIFRNRIASQARAAFLVGCGENCLKKSRKSH